MSDFLCKRLFAWISRTFEKVISLNDAMVAVDF